MSNGLASLLAYLKTIPPAISGSGGHNATLRAACECVRFGVSEADMWEAMLWWNANKCSPPWSEKELRHKLESAKQKATYGERGRSNHRKPVIRPVTAAELAELSARRRARRQNKTEVPTAPICRQPAEVEAAFWEAVFGERGIDDPARE